MRATLASLWDLLFPPRCASCRERGEWLCAECLALCVPHGPGCCRRCGAWLEDGGCLTCALHIRHLDSLTAAYAYEGPVRHLVHALKYRGLTAAADWMALRMAASELPRAELIVPVPLHPRRQHQRGYNQSELLAAALAREGDIPTAGLLRRIRFEEPQTRLSASSRWENVRGAFEPAGELGDAKSVLVVDDVCTTGATMEECAKVLKHMGAATVHGAVFARTLLA